MHKFTHYIKITHPDPDTLMGKKVYESWDEICKHIDNYIDLHVQLLKDFVIEEENKITLFQRQNPGGELPEHLLQLAKKCQNQRELICKIELKIKNMKNG